MVRSTPPDAAVDAIRDWILERNAELSTLSLDTDIIEERVLSSLQFVGLVRYVEEIRGEVIAGDEIEVDHFRSLRQIRDHYLC